MTRKEFIKQVNSPMLLHYFATAVVEMHVNPSHKNNEILCLYVEEIMARLGVNTLQVEESHETNKSKA